MDTRGMGHKGSTEELELELEAREKREMLKPGNLGAERFGGPGAPRKGPGGGGGTGTITRNRERGGKKEAKPKCETAPGRVTGPDLL